MENLFTHLEQVVLRMDSRFCTEDGHLLKNKVVEAALALDPQLLHYLLADEKLKQQFFSEVDGLLVFDKVKFQRFVMNKQFLPDSYTSFKNKVGLTNEHGEFLSESREVVLSWPYKDCMLEGGQTKEDAKRDEIFWNETLAPDEINRLTEPKAFTGFLRYDSKGEHEVTEILPDDNLIIKGNNLLALYSLRKRFRNSVKLIYIDPPYNTKGDANTFSYNNTFNHSSWLTFMENRLIVSRELLRNDGVIAIAIDDEEQAYLKVLADDVFGRENFIGNLVIQIKPSGRTNDAYFATCHEYVLFYAKNKDNVDINFMPLTEEQKKQYKEGLGDEIYKWRDFLRTGGYSTPEERPNSYYPIYYNPETEEISLSANEGSIEIWPIDSEGKKRVWRKTPSSFQEHLNVGEIKVVNNKGIYKVRIIDRVKSGIRPKTIWTDKKYDAATYGTKLLKKLFDGDKVFSFPKSLYAVKDVISLFTDSDENDLVLDFFGGSGTTAHAVSELNHEDGGNRKFILCEQMDYVESVTAKRVQMINKEFDEDSTLWGGNNSFLYMELAQANQKLVEEIEAATDTKSLQQIWKQMQEKGFMSYKVKPSEIDKNVALYEELSLDDQKRFLIECLDKNLLYVPFEEMDDATYQMSEHDKQLTRQFYARR